MRLHQREIKQNSLLALFILIMESEEMTHMHLSILLKPICCLSISLVDLFPSDIHVFFSQNLVGHYRIGKIISTIFDCLSSCIKTIGGLWTRLFSLKDFNKIEFSWVYCETGRHSLFPKIALNIFPVEYSWERCFNYIFLVLYQIVPWKLLFVFNIQVSKPVLICNFLGSNEVTSVLN